MSRQEQPAMVLDYRQANAVDSWLPQPAVLASSGWQGLHLEIFQQPEFEIAEHQHTMHVLACGLPCFTTEQALVHPAGERWLDGKLQRETRNQGDIAIIPADISHRCNWNSSVQFMVLAIEPTLLQQVGQDWIDRDRIELQPRFMNQPDVLIQGIFSTLKAELETGGIGSTLLVDSLKSALAIHLLRNYCTVVPKPLSRSIASGGLAPLTLTRVTNYIEDQLQQNLRLEEIAAIAQISQYHFLRLFKRSVGMTLHQYILHRRIERAKDLLQHSQLSLAEIALTVGFCDQSHLTRSFKRMTGVSPKQFLKG